jgi:hypothetical protein
MRFRLQRTACCCVAFACSLSISAAAQTYKAIGQYRLTGTSVNALAVDSISRRLFAAGSDGIDVYNLDTGAPAGHIATFADAKDVLLVPEESGEEAAAPARAFAADDKGNVIEFSLSDLKVIAKSKLPTSGAAALCYGEEDKVVAAVSAGGSLASFDATSGKLMHSGKLPTGAGQIGCGTLHHVYVADPVANVVRVLNDETLKNEGDIPVPDGDKPSGLTLDTKGRRLFVGCENGMIDVIDTDAGFTFIHLAGGMGPAREIFTWLPQGKGQWKAAAFIAQQDGTLSVVRMNAFINYSLGGTYKLQPGLGAIAYDANTHHLFIASTDAGAPVVSIVGY